MRVLRGGLSALTISLTLGLYAQVWAQDGSLEYAVKAAYLSKFAPFVQWPDSAFATPSSPIALCVVGEDPFEDMIDRAVGDRTADRRAIQVRHLDRVTAESGCHIMFATGSSDQSVAEALEAVRGTPVLTVTEAQRQGGPAGIIDFVLRDDRVQFAIDDQAAAVNGLKISSKLLSLAVSVNPRVG